MGRPVWLLMFLLVARRLQDSTQLSITNMNIPLAVKAGEEDAILDCDYDLEGSSSDGLVIKWYLNSYLAPNSYVLAYQWIYKRHPQATDMLEKYVDLKYKASSNPRTMYRALKLNKPDIELGGEYTCVISTFADEQTASQNMMVYATEEKFELVYKKKNVDGKNGVELICTAKGVYPQPTIDISVEDVPVKQVLDPIETDKDGKYKVLSRVTLKDRDVPDPAIVSCVLAIPEVNYSVSRQVVYYPGPPTTTSTTTSTTKPPRNMETQTLNGSQANGGNSAFTIIGSFLCTMMKLLTVILLVLYSCE